MKYVYAFEDGNKDMRDLLGGKGANLAEMTNLGLPVPSGFTITTEACNNYYDNNEVISEEIKKEIFKEVKKLEEKSGKKFGSLDNPLLVSVRSGARASMPGMMDTILNLGINDEVVEAFAKKTNNPRFAYDSYRRFIQMYSDVVMGIDKSLFEKEIDKIKKNKGIKYDIELEVEDFKILVDKFRKIYEDKTSNIFPQDYQEQLIGAIEAVFKSWNNPRAIVYRRMNDIPKQWGTAVNVQMMVFGNMSDKSSTGVAFTRDPALGTRGIYGEYLINAQGEDVVAGIRTPLTIEKLKEDMPNCYNEFVTYAKKLENHYKDMQDMEFTIEEEKLYILQTRNGKRTAQAAVKIACDLVDEGMISNEEALLRIDAKSLDQLLHPVFNKDELAKATLVATGLPASPGAASGKVVFDAETAKKRAALKEKVVLVRLETTPEDIEGMIVAEGLLTVRGGRTSHAAVVARGMGTCCVSGCSDIIIDEVNKKFTLHDYTFNEGDYISLDGSTGNIYEGEIKVSEATISGDLDRIMKWADEVRTLKVRTNADNPSDLKRAIELGAEGVGLCRSEHMFFDDKRIVKMRKMILADTIEKRTDRYLDPPLHEFLPKTEAEMENLASDMKITLEEVKNKCISLHEFNPMMGHRGCRLAVTYPEIAIMQTKAIIEAAIEVNKEEGYNIKPEIMIPLVGDIRELKFVKDIIVKTAEEVKKDKNSNLEYQIGTMIELPRAALTADKLANEAEFFSFGTNDLTQMTFGFSRDDASKFLDSYYQNQIYEIDPFARIDEDGVGELMKIAIEKGRKTRPNIKLGICGEHGGEPSSIELCSKLGLDYVSCSPYRIPIARLAAAQANLHQIG